MARPKSTGERPQFTFRITKEALDCLILIAKERGQPWTKSSVAAQFIEEGIVRYPTAETKELIARARKS